MATIITLSNHKGRNNTTTYMLNYLKTILGKIIFYTLYLTIISCNTGLSNTSSQGFPLMMEITRATLVGEETTVEAHLSLANNAQSAILDSYQLKVTFTPIANNNSKLFYTNLAGHQTSATSKPLNLNLFTERSELGLEDEMLIIPFELEPAININNLIITFELLDNSGRTIQTKQVAWQRIASSSLPMSPSATRHQVEPGQSDGSMPISFEVHHPSEKEHKRKVSTIYEHEKEENVGVASKQPESPQEFYQPSKKGRYIDRQAHEKGGQVSSQYKALDIEELASLASNNDINAQEEIIIRSLNGLFPKSLINPFAWQGVEERALKDQRYIYLLLLYSKQTRNYPLDPEIIQKVIRDAEAGDPIAQNNLRFMYKNGHGEVAQNYQKAFEWFEKAAHQGDRESQFNLGVMYENGRRITKDVAKAFEWYKKAAEKGDVRAQCSLGNMYYYGRGVTKDVVKAFEWFKKAAEKGHVTAQCSLGVMYRKGEGITKDYQRAFEWYEKAAHQGDRESQFNLGIMYKNGEGVTKDYQRAFEWYGKAAEKGDVRAQCSLGVMYKNGRGVTKDVAKAIEWYEKAAEKGSVDAQFILGVMYQHGQEVIQDYQRAFEWYEKAAHQGDRESQFNLGVMYKNGQGVKKDLARAIFWFIKSKNKQPLLPIFTFNNTFSSEGDTAIQQEMGPIVELTLPKWQSIIVQKERDRTNTHAELLLNSYQRLEEIFTKLMYWHHQLNTQAGLLVNCLHFTNQTYTDDIVRHQQATQVIPYIKQHTTPHGKAYASFSEDNVKLSDEIMEELTYKQLHNETMRILKEIKKSYQYAQTKASGEASYIEEKLQQKDLDEKEKEELQRKLIMGNELSKVFSAKLQAIEEEAAYFNTYYQLLFEQIEKESPLRNHKFREENDYQFLFK
ncbi:MAG: SEL1-like repeat protein [Candidatus Amoebophilus sp.]